jgi:hypothetical protein
VGNFVGQKLGKSYWPVREARHLYQQLKVEERDPSGVDLSAAMRVCPQGINIAQRLDKAKQLLSV